MELRYFMFELKKCQLKNDLSRQNRIPVFIFKNAQTKYIKAVWSDKYSFGSKKRQRKLPPPVVCNVSLLCIWLLFQLIINSSIYMYFNLFSALLRKILRKIKVQKKFCLKWIHSCVEWQILSFNQYILHGTRKTSL